MPLRFATIALFSFLMVGLSGCSQHVDTTAQEHPVPITSGDECHVCGMLIKRFPGPKAEAYVQGQKTPFKFCSTRDLFAWYLQPETGAVVGRVFVHDMGATDWKNPSDKDFIDAHKAWYVVGSDAKGAMGPTFASFGKRAEAEAFAAKHGGKVVSFSAVDLAMLDSLNKMGGMPGMPMGAKGSKSDMSGMSMGAKGSKGDMSGMPMGGAKGGMSNKDMKMPPDTQAH